VHSFVTFQTCFLSFPVHTQRDMANWAVRLAEMNSELERGKGLVEQMNRPYDAADSTAEDDAVRVEGHFHQMDRQFVSMLDAIEQARPALARTDPVWAAFRRLLKEREQLNSKARLYAKVGMWLGRRV
jgi:hypothetical protein